MSFISKSSIQEVNNRLDAISLVNDYVRLEKKGGRWWGRCPFHSSGQEKTPSFKVDPDLKMYHCFGCSKGGSVVDFVMEMEKLSFPEAIKSLARKLGIEIVYEDGGAVSEQVNSQKEELFELYRRTNITFQHFLREKPEGQTALKYIRERGISDEMIDLFKLGYAPAERDFLHKFLKQKGYSDEFLEKSGLFSARYRNSPLFSGRLMFPITDRQGRIAGFGGRALPGVLQSDGNEPPKYINSPETEIYKKGQTLYAIDLALPEIRKTKTAYLAEGYMDVIALHQGGITNAVAPLGTAFTDEQAVFLHRWAENAVLVFDSDEAGEKAAYKAIITCRKNGISSSLCNQAQVLEEEGIKDDKFKDPAEILQKFGPKVLKKILKSTINDFEYLISRSKAIFASSGDKKRAAAFMFPFLDSLESEVHRDDCIAQIADMLRIERGAVQKDYFDRRDRNNRHRSEQPSGNNTDFENFPVRRTYELLMLTAAAVNMELYPQLRCALEIKDIDDPWAKELFISLEECFSHDEIGIDFLLARIRQEPLKKFIAASGTSGEFNNDSSGSTADPLRIMEDGVSRIKMKKLRRRLTEIGAEMREIERERSESSGLEELLAEKKYIDSQMRKLEKR